VDTLPGGGKCWILGEMPNEASPGNPAGGLAAAESGLLACVNPPGLLSGGTASPASAKKSMALGAPPKYTTWPSDSRHSLSKRANTSEEGWWITLRRAGNEEGKARWVCSAPGSRMPANQQARSSHHFTALPLQRARQRKCSCPAAGLPDDCAAPLRQPPYRCHDVEGGSAVQPGGGLVAAALVMAAQASF